MKFTVNKEFVEEIVKYHVLMDNDVDADDVREVYVTEDEDNYIVDVVLESEFK